MPTETKRKPPQDARPRSTWRNPGGRPPLPSWFRERGPDALRMLAACATGEAQLGDSDAAVEIARVAAPELRVRAAVDMADRIYGRAQAAPTLAAVESTESHDAGETAPPTAEETAARVRALESVLTGLAEQGDRAAAIALLSALDPTRYGAPGRSTPTDDTVDLVDWVPAVVMSVT